MKSSASAIWEGGLKDGKGHMSGTSGVFRDAPYTFEKRFERDNAAGTTPEELVAAAHASCYAMALSGDLQKAGGTPVRLTVKCTVTMDPIEGKPTVHTSALDLEAVVTGIDEAKFQESAERVKDACPISRLLKANITLVAKLVPQHAR